jgi:hypothetical protein
MSKPKEMGKPVSDLTPEELRREQGRCRIALRYMRGVALKGIRKRLHEIDRRVAREFEGDK